MTQDYKHPSTPPPELVQQWQDESPETQIADHIEYLVTRAAQWGADQELEACCGLLIQQGFDVVDDLRATRRPKPPSLKEQALCELVDAYNLGQIDDSTYDTIRKALKALPND